jgi:hypothetical protein
VSPPLVALGVPHAEWLLDRAEMMSGLRAALGLDAPPPWVYAREFTDREHWQEWFPKMLEWACACGGGRGATHFVTLQDDVEVAPHFWPSLRAMLSAWPDEVIGLAATHSLAREVARQGRRSYRTPRLVGWGWAMPIGLVRELLEWMAAGNLAHFRQECPLDGEDTLTMAFLHTHQIQPRSPVPTIVDHLHVASTNAGFDDHTHRRAVVTWRGYEPADMAEPTWWQTACTDLPHDDWRRCWWCGKRPEFARSPYTGALVCRVCLGTMVLRAMGIDARAGT